MTSPFAGRLSRGSRRLGSWARASCYRHPLLARLVPAAIRNRHRLRPPPTGQRRVEVGCGWSQREGYIHVDIASHIPGIDLICPGDRIPLPSAWADEILSMHMIEHVAPPALEGLLRHWHDLLRPGGKLVIHTPNGSQLGLLLSSGRVTAESYWAAQSAIFGYSLHPAEANDASRLVGAVEHRALLTFEATRWLLEEAGFVQIEDVTGHDPACHHQRDWQPIVPRFCLEVSCRRG